jgi:hypothetical protein
MSVFVKTAVITFFFFFAIIFIAAGTIAYMLAPKPNRKRLFTLIVFVAITVVYLLNLLFLPSKTPDAALFYLTQAILEIMLNFATLTFVSLKKGILRLIMRIGLAFFVVEMVAMLVIIYFFPQLF